VKEVRYDSEKNKSLKIKRGINFDDVSELIQSGNPTGFIGVIQNPNKKKYPKQRMFLVKFNKYIYVIPFVEEEKYIFLKTIYPSRKYTKKYLRKIIS